MVDTAGLRVSDDEIEQIGVSLAQRKIDQADLVLRLCDITNPQTDRDNSQYSAGSREICMFNKIDLPHKPLMDSRHASMISAKTGQGVTELMKTIVRKLVSPAIEPGTPIPFTQRQQTHIEQAFASMSAGKCDDSIACLRRVFAAT
jgi:tRNA modification GTPase